MLQSVFIGEIHFFKTGKSRMDSDEIQAEAKKISSKMVGFPQKAHSRGTFGWLEFCLSWFSFAGKESNFDCC